ncbi:hypothetical protein [Paenibacillus sp. Z6-24]
MANIGAQLVGNISQSLSVSISRQLSIALSNISINVPVYNITNSFNQVNQTVQNVNNHLTQLNVTQNNFNNTLQLTQAAQQRITDTINDTADAQNNLNDSSQKAEDLADKQASKWENIKNHIAKAAAFGNKLASGAYGLGKDSLAGAAEDDTMRRKFVVTTGSGQEGTELFEKYKKGALSSGMNPKDVLSGSLSFLKQSANDMQTEKLNNMASKLSVLSGQSYNDTVNALISGMQGDTKSLNNSFGISAKGMENAGVADKGKSGDVDGYIQSLDALMEKQGFTQKAFDTMMDSPSAKWTQLTNNYSNTLASVGSQALTALVPALDALNNAFESDQFQVLIDVLTAGFVVVANVVAMLVNGLLFLTGVIQQHWDIVSPILSAIAFVLLAAMIIQLGIIAAEWLMINWPILLVVAAIALVISILQMMGISGSEMMGMIVGAIYAIGEVFRIVFMAAWAFVAIVVNGVVKLWYDAVFTVQTIFYSLKMYFLQVMYDLVYGAESFANGFTSLIADAMNSVITGINTILPYFNKLFGTNWGSIDLLKGTDFHGASDSVKKMMGALESQAPQKTKNMFQMDQPEINANVGGANQNGIKAWQGLSDKLTNGTSKVKDSLSNYQGTPLKGADVVKTPPPAVHSAMNHGGATGVGVGMPGGYPPAGNTENNINNVKSVDSIRNIEGTVDISSEDLKLLRNLAEIQAIQHFVNLTPTVQVTTGDINSGADLDTIVGHIGRKLEEEFVSTAQGVYT